ncbi:hypothetical protein ACFRLW_50065, partial [Streptomyces sp. NPDC056728]
MTNTGQLSRRSLLAAAGFAGLAVLTGCGSGDDGGDSKDLSKKRNGAMKKYDAGEQFKATKALSFAVLHNDNPTYPLKKNWLFWKEPGGGGEAVGPQRGPGLGVADAQFAGG